MASSDHLCAQTQGAEHSGIKLLLSQAAICMDRSYGNVWFHRAGKLHWSNGRACVIVCMASGPAIIGGPIQRQPQCG